MGSGSTRSGLLFSSLLLFPQLLLLLAPRRETFGVTEREALDRWRAETTCCRDTVLSRRDLDEQFRRDEDESSDSLKVYTLLVVGELGRRFLSSDCWRRYFTEYSLKSADSRRTLTGLPKTEESLLSGR